MLRKQQAVLRREWEQAQRREQRERHGKERASLKLRQDFDLQRKLAELDSRERKGREDIARDLEAARKADIPATGARRIFQTVTGQNMRDSVVTPVPSLDAPGISGTGGASSSGCG